MSATPAVLASPFRALRRALASVERALRPGDVPAAPGPDAGATVDDPTTTRELLVPAVTGEAPAARASRQARDYLERRRNQLRRQLDGR